MLMNHFRDLKNRCLFEIAFILVYSSTFSSLLDIIFSGLRIGYSDESQVM